MASASPETCGGAPLVVEFIDAGQALAALVKLPDERVILIDAGESPTRAACGAPCRGWHEHVMERARAFLGAARLDLLWITHPHSDHAGGAVDVIEAFEPRAFVDNGRDADKREISRVLGALEAAHVPHTVVEPGHADVPLEPSPLYRLSAVVPNAWPASCKSDANDCSIGLRIDYCASSILFVGDAERREEAELEIAPVTLLQVGHHGSDTSSTESFLARARPRYAVISAGEPDEGTNVAFCHPRVSTVERLNRVLGDAGPAVVRAFDGALPCGHDEGDGWRSTPTSEHLWITARDGDVTLVTTGDGSFVRR